MNASSNNRTLENQNFKKAKVDVDIQTLLKSAAKNRTSGAFPDKDEVISLMRRLGIPYNIVEHQIAVMRKAGNIAHNIVHATVDSRSVKMGALLHDIGRIQDHGLAHAYLGGDIIRNLGYPEKIARMAEKHSLGGITQEEAAEMGLPDRDYVPRTLEEKIVCLADKYFSGKREVTIEERFAKWIDKFGENPFLLSQIARVRAIEEEILHLIHD